MSPAMYEAIRDSCIKRKKDKNDGKVSEQQIQDCKKMAAIQYFKRTGKPVKHSDSQADVSLVDPIELEILDEQVEFFGSLEQYDEWNKD